MVFYKTPYLLPYLIVLNFFCILNIARYKFKATFYLLLTSERKFNSIEFLHTRHFILRAIEICTCK